MTSSLNIDHDKFRLRIAIQYQRLVERRWIAVVENHCQPLGLFTDMIIKTKLAVKLFADFKDKKNPPKGQATPKMC